MEIKMEHRMTQAEGKIDNLEHRADEMEKRQHNLERLTSTVEKLALKEETIEETVNEIKTDVKELTNKPVKRWDGAVDKAVSAIVGGLIAYVFFKLGLG
jgi:hypothetical protein